MFFFNRRSHSKPQTRTSSTLRLGARLELEELGGRLNPSTGSALSFIPISASVLAPSTTITDPTTEQTTTTTTDPTTGQTTTTTTDPNTGDTTATTIDPISGQTTTTTTDPTTGQSTTTFTDPVAEQTSITTSTGQTTILSAASGQTAATTTCSDPTTGQNSTTSTTTNGGMTQTQTAITTGQATQTTAITTDGQSPEVQTTYTVSGQVAEVITTVVGVTLNLTTGQLAETTSTTISQSNGQVEQVVTVNVPYQLASTYDYINGQLVQLITQAISAPAPGAGAGAGAATTTIIMDEPVLLGGDTWYVQGQINGPNNTGVTVTFSGLAGLQGRTTTTLAGGIFQIAFEPGSQSGNSGSITATATVNGQTIDTWVGFFGSGS